MEKPPLGPPYWMMLLAALAALIMLSSLWGTAFTCDDDLFTSTAWQRWGAGAQGWPAVFRASWVMAVDQGRFYDVVTYTLAQFPYMFHAIPVANAFRIGSMLFVFVTFALMMTSLLRDIRLALFFTIIPIALLQTTYGYNPFHAYPLWFNLGGALLFLSVFLFHESWIRKNPALRLAAAVVYFWTLLLYESFLFYSIVFLAVAYVYAPGDPARPLARVRHAIAGASGIIVSAGVYLGLYIYFNRVHPPNYAGRFLSLAAPAAILNTIVQFSISGLNYRLSVLHDLQWSLRAAAVSLSVFLLTYMGMTRYSRNVPGRVLASLVVWAPVGMLLPNILYGFTERYRNWVVNSGNFYLGSFYSAFAEAILVGALAILMVRIADRFRLATAAAVCAAGVFAVAAYANIRETDKFFRPHQENRHNWELVDNLLSGDHSGIPCRNAVIVAPALVHMPWLDTAPYDYWSYYFTYKVGCAVRVVGSPAESLLLPEPFRSSPVFGLATSYFPAYHAGLAALGPIDIAAWRNHPEALVSNRARVAVTSQNEALLLKWFTAAGKTVTQPAKDQMTITDAGPLNLSALVLQR